MHRNLFLLTITILLAGPTSFGKSSAAARDLELGKCWGIDEQRNRLTCFDNIYDYRSTKLKGSTEIDCKKDSNSRFSEPLEVNAVDLVHFPEKYVCRPVRVRNFGCYHVKDDLINCDSETAPIAKIMFRAPHPNIEEETLIRQCDDFRKLSLDRCERSLTFTFNGFDEEIYHSEGKEVRSLRAPVVSIFQRKQQDRSKR